MSPATDRSDDLHELRAVVREVLRKDGRAIGLDEPLMSEAAAQEAVTRALETFGKFDALLTCPPAAPARSIARVDESAWHELVAKHLTATFLPARATVRWMSENNQAGRIVCFTGSAGTATNEFGQSHLAAVMGGVCGFVRALAHELRHKPITVNAITSAPLEGPNTQEGDGENAENAAQLGRFLLSPAAAEITGQVIALKGKHISTTRSVSSAGAMLEPEQWTIEALTSLWSRVSR